MSQERLAIMENLSVYFGPIMVIGSILAAIFGAGALWNSIMRKRLIRTHQLEDDEMTFRPPTPEEIAAPPAPATPPASTPLVPPAPAVSLFRQIGPTGITPDAPAKSKEALYVWE